MTAPFTQTAATRKASGHPDATQHERPVSK
jgi:hypothetical protein